MANTREVIERDQPIGPGEQLAFILTTTPWGGTGLITGVVVSCEDADGVDSEPQVFPTNSPSVNDTLDQITTSLARDVAVLERHKVTILWVQGGNTFEAEFYLVGE